MAEPEKSFGEQVLDEFALAVAENARVPALDEKRLQAALDYLGSQSMIQVFGAAQGPDSDIVGAKTLLTIDSEAGRYIGKDVHNGAIVGPYVLGDEVILGGIGVWVPSTSEAEAQPDITETN